MKLSNNLVFNEIMKKKKKEKGIVQLFPIFLKHKPALENPKISQSSI